MGRKLDALLGRKFKTSKFKATVNLAVSRLSVLKNQRQSRLAVARSDIVQLLNLNHHEHALQRVDQVIKEQNMLDVFIMADGYCHLLLQRINLVEQQKDCPDELKEAISSLLFAAPRCGEFPELQEIRAILTSRYGKEFVNGAIELRSNCGVNPKMIQKLSPRQSRLETRMKILQEIATENGTVLQLEDTRTVINKVVLVENNSMDLADEVVEVLSFSGSMKGKKKFRDVEDAAQAAFESAAYAAAAARAAVELSRSRSFGSDNPDSPNSRPRKVLDSKSEKLKFHESELQHEHNSKNIGETSETPKLAADYGGSGSDSDGRGPVEKTMVFYESEAEIETEPTGFSSPGGAFDHKRFPVSGKETEGGSGRRFDDGSMVEEKVVKLDLTKPPISVRTRRVYGR